MKRPITSILFIISMICIIFTMLPIERVMAAEASTLHVLSYPSKVRYELGEEFDMTGFQVVTAEKKQQSMNDKITFYTSKTVELTQGRKFQTDGVKIVELRYQGKKIGAYEITVMKQVEAPTKLQNTGVIIESFPRKTTYKYNEVFDTTGLKVVTNDSKKTNVTDKITFVSTVYGWELTKNYKMDFSNRAEYRISLRYNGTKIGEYSIMTLGDPKYVTEMRESTTNRWIALSMGPSSDEDNYVTINANGNAELRNGGSYYKYYIKSADKRGPDGSNYKFFVEYRGVTNDKQVQITLKMEDGRYLGIGDEIKNGVQLKAVNEPYVWFSSRGYLYPPASSNMLANASGKSYKDGTKIILWDQPYTVIPYDHAQFSMLSTTDPAGIKKGLYSLAGNVRNNRINIFDKIDGEIIGYLPYFGVVVEVVESKGDWAKISFDGRTHYISTRLTAMTKIKQPSIIASSWAKKWWGYTGSVIGTTSEYPKVKTEWTKGITNEDMAKLLVGVMVDIYGDWIVRYGTSFTKDNSKVSWSPQEGDDNWYVKDKLFRWGVFTDAKMKWNGNPTYGEYTNYLIKLVDFDHKASEGSVPKLTAADIKKFGIGGNINSKSKITKEQANILREKVVDWYAETTHENLMMYAEKYPGQTGAAKTVITGVYTIQSQLGKNPNLVINSKGEGEINNKKTQKFKITYLGGERNAFGLWWPKYTIQTMDGKYLALSNAFKNGITLKTQKKSYIWKINDNVIGQMVMAPWDNPYQLLNVSGSKTADGTPVVSGLWDTGDNGLTTPESNFGFIFTYIGKK